MSKLEMRDNSRSRLDKEEISKALSSALCAKGLISELDTSVLFYDLGFMTDRIEGLKAIFPSGTLHAIAAKANPLTKILSGLKELDLGLEVASLPELLLAEKIGFQPGKIVFDSPVKTKEELEYALRLGVYINADSFAELDRIGEILKTIKSNSLIGLRINPQVGTGTIKSTSVATEISKFGIPINFNTEKLKEYYIKYSWLKGIHVHIGSQGCPVALMIEGLRRVLDLALELNKSLQISPLNRKIEYFDIGGGLPVTYSPDHQPPTMEEYYALLKENCSELFNSGFNLITEFGRYIHANAAWAVSKVEYVKREKNINILMTHLGADLLLRKCYNPDDWHHEISVFDRNGKPKTGKDLNKYIVAGPLCFANDVIARDIELPYVDEGDYIVIHDVGAYTMSMWSRYNSRQIPKVIAYTNSENDFEIIKKRENPEDLFDFWT